MANVCAAGSDPLDRVFAYVYSVIELSQCSQSKSSLAGTFAQELYESSPKIQTNAVDPNVYSARI